MLNSMLNNISNIYIAYGATDFRKQIWSLVSDVKENFKIDACKSDTAFIFCNKKRTSIKVLCYDKNGFILAQKTMLSRDNMKFKWPRNKGELVMITHEQLRWLLTGLSIYQKKSFAEIDINNMSILN